jgi:hypothetical protein
MSGTRFRAPSPRQQTRSRPTLEQLEDRTVPSTIAGSYTDGVWRWDSSAGWAHLTNMQATILHVDDAGDVYGQYTDGLWRWGASTGWAHLESTSGMGTAKDFQVTSSGVLYADFGTSGIWRWSFDGWQKISNLAVTSFAVSRSDAFFGRFDVGVVGLWRWTPTSGWGVLTGNTPDNVQADNAGDFAGIFNTGIASNLVGTWRWSPTTGWARLSTSVPHSVDVTASGAIYENRLTDGLWRWAGGSFTELTGADGTFAILHPLADGNLFVHFFDASTLTFVGWYWNASTGWSRPFADSTDIIDETPGKSGELFYALDSGGGTWKWTPTTGVVQLSVMKPDVLGTQA